MAIRKEIQMNQEIYNKIIDELKEHSHRYYVLNIPTISDKDFDFLLKQAEAIELAHPEWKRNDSPTTKPGSDIQGANTLNHKRPMLSLENTYNFEEVRTWYDKMTALGVTEYVIEPKYDGLSFSAKFKDGELVQGLTRGDGAKGEDITRNLQEMYNYGAFGEVSKTFSGEIRGEVLMSKEEFKRLNADGKYANPRNLASGTLKLLDVEEFKKRKLMAFAYWLEDFDFIDKHTDKLEAMRKAGLKTAQYFTADSYEKLIEKINIFDEFRKNSDVDTDGCVLKVNNTKLWNKIGGTSKYPHWAKAYKYDPETAVTRVKNIEFWVGHAGKITPVAILEPVELSGSTVQKATLNNRTYMEQLDIQIGDYVNIKKAAEIIPFINHVIKNLREGQTRTTVSFPTHCPSCGTELKKYNDEHADSYCMNTSCKARVIGTIVKYTSTMEIDGFAEIIVEKLYDAKLLCSVEDLYTLKDKKEQMINLDRMGTKLVDKLVDNIEGSKNQSFEKFLAAISIKNAGKGTSKRLLKKFNNIDELMKATKQDLVQVEDIGDIVAQNIIDFFNENKGFIETLRLHGVNMKKEKTESETLNLLNGKAFCITGALSRVRSEIEQMIEALGGKNVSGVSKNTDYLVTNDQVTQTSKLTKAKELGVKIISEMELIEMLTK
jgi:DNA ligase (NAD+)